MNSANASESRDTLMRELVEKYSKDGYEVTVDPSADDLPFDLGSYRPDLIAKKTGNGGFIIEVKISARQTLIDRYCEIAEIVSQHAGWRFLLVTSEGAENGSLLSWEQIVAHKEKGERLAKIGENEAAYLSLWITLEALMRTKAEQASIPIEFFPTSSLIKHLYSQGELSIEQFDKAMNLLSIRNRLSHGFQEPNLERSLTDMQDLVKDIISQMSAPASCAA